VDELEVETSYETVWRWLIKFRAAFARNLRQQRCQPSGPWHLDETNISILGRGMYLWRAADTAGGILDLLVQPRR